MILCAEIDQTTTNNKQENKYLTKGLFNTNF